MRERKTKRLIQSLLVGCILSTGTFVAKSDDMPDLAKMDAAVQSVMTKEGGVGAIVAVMRQGNPLLVRSYGLADIEHQVPVKRETVFQSGSVGKMFTATAIMLLVEDGKLKLDDTLLSHFPDGPDYWGRVTVSRMLSHTGGMARLYGPSSRDIFTLSTDYSDEELIKIIASLPMQFEPGTSYQYSNSAYIMLGMLVKKVSGQFYGDYLAEKLFRPVGMRHTQVNEPSAIIPNRAEGYEAKDEKPVRAAYVSRALSRTADGSLLFTIDDVIKWEQALRQSSFLPAEALESMFSARPFPDGTAGIVNYGAGWITRDRRGHRLVDHSGYWQGFSTYLARYIDDEFTVAVLTNSINGTPRDIADTVATFFNPDYASYEAITDANPQLTSRLKGLIFDYLEGRTNPAGFTDTEADFLSPKQVRRTASFIKANRSDATFTLVHQRVEDDRNIYVYKLSGGRRSGPYDIQFDLTKDGKVINLSFQAAG